MTRTMRKLDAVCLDALREVGNIGAGHAMSALAELLNQTVDMSVPHAGITALGDFHCDGGRAGSGFGRRFICTWTAKRPVTSRFCCRCGDAFRLVDRMLMQDTGNYAGNSTKWRFRP